jgi:uncharacterized protein YndB with AHSA1/START domain
MPEAANEIVIARPQAEVFAFLANAENDKRWRGGILDIEHVSGRGVGARYRQGMSGPRGRRIDADIEISEYEPDRLIGFRAVAGPVRPRGRYTLTALDGETSVRLELHAEVRGLKKLMAPMVQRAMDNQVAALSQLKRILEAT